MPIYEFRCKKCNAHLEVFQKLNDKPPVRCRKCRGRLERIMSRTAIQFKGEGWYVTDYASKGNKAEKAEKDKPASETTAASDTTKSSEKAKAKEAPKKIGSDPA